MFAGPETEAPSNGIAGRLLRLEDRLLPYPGRPPEPLQIQDLPDDLPDFDIIVDFRSGGPSKKLLAHTRRELWWFAELDESSLLRGAPSLTVSLLGQSPDQKDARLVSQIRVQSKILVSRTRGFADEKALQLVRRELARPSLASAPPRSPAPPRPPAPTRSGDLAGYVFRVFRKVQSQARSNVGTKWDPGRGFALRMGEGTPGRFDPRQGRDHMHPHKGWYADPFLLEHDGDLFCFFEDLPHGSDKARIGVARVRENRLEFLGSALETGYHLSFPFVFKHEGEIFMLPETIGANRVEVWKATDFPLGWTRHAVALEGQQFADPVLLEHDGAWWLFANPSNDSIGDFNSELWLFRVGGLDLKKIEPHPLNPVVVGSDTARSAGRVLCVDGRLLRLSQDNSGNIYGYGLNIMEVTTLTVSDYQERRIRHICPDDIPGAAGCHHIDFRNGRFAMDIRWP